LPVYVAVLTRAFNRFAKPARHHAGHTSASDPQQESVPTVSADFIPAKNTRARKKFRTSFLFFVQQGIPAITGVTRWAARASFSKLFSDAEMLSHSVEQIKKQD
jgi:hypothetical protein